MSGLLRRVLNQEFAQALDNTIKKADEEQMHNGVQTNPEG
jgi:hypothetical protein